jgi:hypothetical protein
LRDYSGDGPVSERGIEILRETPETAAMPDLKRRVWSSLQRIEPQVGLRMPGVKALALGITIFSIAGTAGAVITGRWIVPALDRGDAGALPTAARAERRRPVRRIAAVPAHDEAVTAVTAPAAAPAPLSVRTRARVSAASTARAAAASSAQERTQVLDALVALRHDHDAVRAGALLDQYLVAHPRGTLREEALALATEAADARGDHATAQRFARSYLADYPEGRFRQFARNHTQSPAASPIETP